MTKDYNETLARGIEDIRDRVKRGMLPLVARNPALDKLTSEYAMAQAEHYHARQAKAEKEGRDPNAVPAPFRDAYALEQCANLVLYEELTWSHPDKMSIVEYPIMSDRNEESYFDKYTPHDDLRYDDRRFAGRRKSHSISDDGTPSVGSPKIAIPYDVSIERLGTLLDLQDALDNAGLTARQRQAIELVYFEDMTQEQAADVMGVSQPAIAKFERQALVKLREYMTKE